MLKNKTEKKDIAKTSGSDKGQSGAKVEKQEQPAGKRAEKKAQSTGKRALWKERRIERKGLVKEKLEEKKAKLEEKKAAKLEKRAQRNLRSAQKKLQHAEKKLQQVESKKKTQGTQDPQEQPEGKSAKPFGQKANSNPDEKSKKPMIFLIALLSVAVVTGVATFFLFGVDFIALKKAEKAVGGMFSAFHELDFEKAGKYIDTDSLVLSEPYVALGNSQIFMDTLFNQLNYEIISSEWAGEERAAVKTNISAVRMKPIMANFVVESFNFAFRDAYSSIPLDSAQKEKRIAEIFEGCVSSLKLETVKNEVDIHVERSDGGWVVVADDNLINALFGGLLETRGNFFSRDLPEDSD